jgi:hypothetical protein
MVSLIQNKIAYRNATVAQHSVSRPQKYLCPIHNLLRIVAFVAQQSWLCGLTLHRSQKEHSQDWLCHESTLLASNVKNSVEVVSACAQRKSDPSARQT